MSDIPVGTASAKFTGDVSGLRGAVGSAVQTLSNLEPVVARQWWGLQNLSKAFGAVGSAVAAGFTVAINEAIGWESALVGIQRTTGASNEELAQMEQQLRKVAETTPIAVSELANLAEQAGALGIANTDIPEFVRVLGNLIASTNLTTADVDDLARVLNILQVPVDSFDRFASTLLDVGRNTAATETEILSMAKRFAPAAAAAGVLADQVLAISAAVLSLGPRAEAGGTAVNKTFYDMATAIATGGNDLDNFAKVSGRTSDQFIHDFQTAPAETFAAFVTGLGTMNGGLIAQEKALRDLGITEVRQQQALIALSEGTRDVGNQQHDLNAILALAHHSWVDNTALVEVAKQRYGTTAAQLTILRNEIAAAANDLGKALLPAIKFVVGVLQDFIFGFTQLPGPIQLALGAIIAIIGAISLLAGGVLALIGPLVLMMQTWRSLVKTFTDTAASAAVATAPLAAVAVETERIGATAIVASEQLALLDTELNVTSGAAAEGSVQLQLFAAEEQNVQRQSAATGAAMTGAATGGLAAFAKGGAIVGTVLTIAAIGLTLFGHRARAAAQATEEAVKPNLALVDALEQERAGTKGAADEWLLQQITMAGVIDVASKLGGELWGLVDVLNVIKGASSFEQAKVIIDAVKSAADAGDAKAKNLLNFMIDTNGVFRESESAAGQLRTARGDLGITTDNLTDSTKDLAKAEDDQRQIQEDINQATIGSIDAYFALADAEDHVKEAQKAYAKAVDDAAHASEAEAIAEWKVLQAQQAHNKALEDLGKAYDNLANARANQQNDLVDAQNAVQDANDRYLDSLDKIADDEKKLDDLRNTNSIDEITKATNKLADAQLRLRHSEQAVKDAEWQLAYLRGEGASERAISDAELTLDDARQQVKDNTQDVKDAEKDLAKTRAGADPKEIAKAERDLEKARRDSASAARDIEQKEKDLQKIRDDIANDTAYKDAQSALVDAQINVGESLGKTRDAERELAEIRSGSLQQAVVQKQRDLERALLDQAKAATEVDKQQALMRGEFYDTGRYAHDLAGHLGELFDTFPTDDAKQHVQDWVATLNTAVALGDNRLKNSKTGGYTPAETAGIFGLPNNEDIGRYLQSLKKQMDQDTGPSFWERLIGSLTSINWGTVIGAAVGLIGGPVTIIIGALIGSLIAEFWPEISGFFVNVGQWIKDELPGIFSGFGDWLLGALTAGLAGSGPTTWLTHTGWDIIQGLWGGISDKFGELFSDIGGWFYDNIVDPIKSAFGIDSPSKVFSDIGGDIIQGLLNGLQNAWGNLWNWITGMPGWIGNVFTNAGDWLLGAGWDLLSGLFRGASNQWGEFWNNFLVPLPGWIGNAFSGAKDWLVNAGADILQGLWDGISGAWNTIEGNVKDLGKTIVDVAKKSTGTQSPSTEFRYIGEMLMQGLANGIEGNLRVVKEQMGSLVGALDLSNMVDMNGPNTRNVITQFATEDRWRDMMTQMADLSAARGTGTTQAAVAGQQSGDQFFITGADERSAIDIAEEVMFKKTVRL